MNMKDELNYIRGVLARTKTNEDQYHALKCVEAVVCRLYGRIEKAERELKEREPVWIEDSVDGKLKQSMDLLKESWRLMDEMAYVFEQLVPYSRLAEIALNKYEKYKESHED